MNRGTYFCKRLTYTYTRLALSTLALTGRRWKRRKEIEAMIYEAPMPTTKLLTACEDTFLRAFFFAHLHVCAPLTSTHIHVCIRRVNMQRKSLGAFERPINRTRRYNAKHLYCTIPKMELSVANVKVGKVDVCEACGATKCWWDRKMYFSWLFSPKSDKIYNTWSFYVLCSKCDKWI